MKVLLSDPPQLRLVSSAVEPSRASGSATARRRQTRPSRATLAGPARRLHCRALTASLAAGAPVDREALRVVLVVRQGLYRPEHATLFTANNIWQLLFVEVVGWCRNRRQPVPAGIPSALRWLVTHLDSSGDLHEQSDPLEELLIAIDECTGGIDDPEAHQPGRSSVRSRRGPRRK